MNKYIDADELKAEINNRLMAVNLEELRNFGSHRIWAYNDVKDIIDSLQQEQPETSNNLVDVDAVREDFIAEVYRVLDADPTNDRANAIIDAFDSLPTISLEQPDMIQWTGKNLKEVIDFTGKSPRFGEWFKSWEEFETYVHQHNDILKLFCEDGSHYEVPVGAWIVKTPDGHNVPSIAKYVQQGELGLPGYNKALLEVKSKVDELYEEAGIGLCEYDTGLYNGIAETCMKLRGFIKARLASDEQPEVDLEKEITEHAINMPHGEFTHDSECREHEEWAMKEFRHFYELGLNAKKEEGVSIAESPSKTFPRVNEFDCGSSYRH